VIRLPVAGRGYDSLYNGVLDGKLFRRTFCLCQQRQQRPWGDALTRELIRLWKANIVGDGARLLKGHSSGGWTVLWLQTQISGYFAVAGPVLPILWIQKLSEDQSV